METETLFEDQSLEIEGVLYAFAGKPELTHVIDPGGQIGTTIDNSEV